MAEAADKAIKDYIARFMKETGGPAFDAAFARVKADLEAAEKRLPKEAAGLGNEFIEKLARRYFAETIGSPAFLDALVDQVVKAVRDGHGPTRRNRVALA